MHRREFIKALGGTAAAWPLKASGQRSGKLFRIGFFSAGPAGMPGQLDQAGGFIEGLRELGWIEGKDVVFEQRYAENRLDRLPELAAELVRLKVDVIVATGTLAPLAAKQVTSTIPIVMAPAGDPLGTGLFPVWPTQAGMSPA